MASMPGPARPPPLPARREREFFYRILKGSAGALIPLDEVTLTEENGPGLTVDLPRKDHFPSGPTAAVPTT